ncbi:hypothetical protein UPYG_G00098690 [Umbra pygmaea]|uniref:Fibronectin type-III domain-containing protein n=1 Tax=Umbra pygmaea TaxID=75934 RepID=A0ABD0X1I8_UMBPY
MHFIFLIIFTKLVIADGAIIAENLQCFNDYDSTMVCHITNKISDCNNYRILLETPYGRFNCNFKDEQSPSLDSKCRCSMDELSFVPGEIFTANLFSSRNLLSSRNISISDSIKPKPPTIQYVNLTKTRNFYVQWKTNYGDIKPFYNLNAEMSYGKKGEQHEVLQNISSPYRDIFGGDLEPNTNYSLKIRTYSDISHQFSDWSKEFDFTNPHSPQELFNMFIVFICIAVLIMTSFLFWWGVRLKAKWWDNIPKCSNPELFHMVSGDPKILNPPDIIFSHIYVDSSEMNTTEGKKWTDTNTMDVRWEKDIEVDCSSPLDYPKTYTNNQEPSKMPAIGPFQKLPPNQLMNETEGLGASCCFNNMTYSPSAPFNCLEVPPSETSSSLMQPLHLDPSRRSIEGDLLKHLHPQTFFGNAQPDFSVFTETPLLQTDFSYLSSDSASGASLTRKSAEDTSLTFGFTDRNVSAPHNVTGVNARCHSFSEVVGKDNGRRTDATMPLLTQSFQNVNCCEPLTYDMNPCNQSLTDPGSSLPPSEDDYQAFPSLGLDQFVPEQRAEADRLLNNSQTETPQSSTGNMEHGSPFIAALCTDRTMQIENDSCYHSV